MKQGGEYHVCWCPHACTRPYTVTVAAMCTRDCLPPSSGAASCYHTPTVTPRSCVDAVHVPAPRWPHLAVLAVPPSTSRLRGQQCLTAPSQQHQHTTCQGSTSSARSSSSISKSITCSSAGCCGIAVCNAVATGSGLTLTEYSSWACCYMGCMQLLPAYSTHLICLHHCTSLISWCNLCQVSRHNNG